MDHEDQPTSDVEREALTDLAAAGATIRKAFDALAAKYRARLINRIKRNVPSDLAPVLEAEDVIQEASRKAFRTVLSFKSNGGGTFYSWLATISDNLLIEKIKALRTLKRGGGRVAVSQAGERSPDWNSVAGLLSIVAVNEHTPSSSVARREAAAVLQTALLELNARQCAALILCHLHGWSRERTAEAMNVSVAALGSLLARGLKTLREALGDGSDYLSGV